MITEALLSAVTEAVFGSLLEQASVGERVRAWTGHTAQQVAFKIALARAYTTFTNQYPQWADSLFDEHFLKHRASPLLARCLLRNRPPTPMELATAWADQIGLADEVR